MVRPIFRLLDQGQFKGVVSPATLAECLVKPKQLGSVELQQGFINLLTQTEGILFVTLDKQIGI